jgi:hypothetical protein
MLVHVLPAGTFSLPYEDVPQQYAAPAVVKPHEWDKPAEMYAHVWPEGTRI